MAAIEYGSSYWGVILNGLEPNVPGETVYLHADGMKIDASGALTFTSAGKRPAGAWPEQSQQEKGGDGKSTAQGNGHSGASSGGGGGNDAKEAKSESGKDGGKGGGGADDAGKSGTIYMAFAPGTWRTVFAALLSDGSPAPVEHWTAFGGKQMLETIVSPNAAAKMG